MTIADLISSLRDQGVSLALDEGKLKVRAPKGSVPADLLQQLQAHKHEIFAHFIPAPASPSPSDTASVTSPEADTTQGVKPFKSFFDPVTNRTIIFETEAEWKALVAYFRQLDLWKRAREQKN